MNLEHFDALFDTFHTSAARLETLPAYQVDEYEGARVAAFHAHKPLPERTIATDPWLARIARTTMAGKRWSRVRVIDDPPTDYERFELAVFGESQAVGEQIRVVRRDAYPHWGGDFWLFDAGTAAARVVLLRYGEVGEWLGAHLVDDPEIVAECGYRLHLAEVESVPLNQFLAGARG